MSVEARNLWDKLIDLKLNPTSHMIRHTVVHELVDHVTERMAKETNSKNMCTAISKEDAEKQILPYLQPMFVMSLQPQKLLGFFTSQWGSGSL